jgi:hypothetical protein
MQQRLSHDLLLPQLLVHLTHARHMCAPKSHVFTPNARPMDGRIAKLSRAIISLLSCFVLSTAHEALAVSSNSYSDVRCGLMQDRRHIPKETVQGMIRVDTSRFFSRKRRQRFMCGVPQLQKPAIVKVRDRKSLRS